MSDAPDLPAADDPPPERPRTDRSHLHRQSNLTLRTDDGVMLWARMRALVEGTTVSRLIRGWLEEYARVPPRFWEGYPPPWDVDPLQDRSEPEEERPQPVRERSSWG